MVFKNIVILVVCALYLDLSLVYGQSHIINDCVDPGDNPVVIYDQDVTKAGHLLHTQEQTIRIPASGFANGELSCFTVTNLGTEADGGYPKILEGGVGYNYVIVQLKSQFNKGFDFRVTAYYAG